MNDITNPLRLAVGSHRAGSGQGCAMNVISWENGDRTITDMPACADTLLARIVQNVNDRLCRHRTGDLLCPTCSLLVLDLAHRTVGTSTWGQWRHLPEKELRQVWAQIAQDQARAVAHLIPPSRVSLSSAATAHADMARHMADAVDKLVFLGEAANAGAHAHMYAANAAAMAASQRVGPGPAETERLVLANRAIDLFVELTGIQVAPTPAPVTEAAVAKMLAVR